MIRRNTLLATLLALSTAPAAAQAQLPNELTAPPQLAPSYARPVGYTEPPNRFEPMLSEGPQPVSAGPISEVPSGFLPQQPQQGYTASNVGERYAAPMTPSAAPQGAASWPVQVRREPKPSPYVAPWQLPPNAPNRQVYQAPAAPAQAQAPAAPRYAAAPVAPPAESPFAAQPYYQSHPDRRSQVVQAAGEVNRFNSTGVAVADYQQQPSPPRPPRPSELPPADAQLNSTTQIPATQIPAPQPMPAAPLVSAAPVDPASIPTGAFQLDELVGMAITYNPILRRELASIEASKGERVQAGLYPNPTFETNNPSIFAGQGSFVNFGFMQDIQVKGKLRLEKAAADQLVRETTAEYRLERARLLTDVRKQYYETVAAKHRVYLAGYLAAIAERGVKGARELEKAGEGTQTDVLLLDTEYQREKIKLQNAETTYQGELKQLAAVIGMPQVQIQDVVGTLFDSPPRFSEQDVQMFTTNISTYIEKGRAEITRSQVQLRRAEVEPYPNIRMGPSFQTGTVPTSGQFWLTVEFNIPVWDLNQGNIRAASATVEERLADLEVTRNELTRKSAELFARHQAARDRAERIRVQILPNAQQAQRLIQDAYVKGQFDVNRLLESQRNLAEVSSDYFEAAEESWTTAAEIAGMLQLEQFPQ